MDCPSIANCGGSPFASLHVIPRVTGGTVVAWTLGAVTLKAPLQFQLEVDRAGHNFADDWEIVVPYTPDIHFATDPEQRSAGWFRSTYYRVAVKDADDVVVRSLPIAANQGRLNQVQQRTYNEILRREQKRYGLKNTPASTGYLLKVRYYGTKCLNCIDPDSGEPTTDQCTNCYGIGYVNGYHRPYPCFNVDLGPMPHNLSMYKEQGPMIDGGIAGIRYLNIPPVHPWDVWVDATTDDRYIIGQIQPIAVFGSINLVCNAAAAKLAYDHPVYKIPVS